VKAMHNKEPLWQALADLHACPTFQDVCSQIEQLALDGERTAFSHESVQRSHFHDASGISSLLSRQPGPLSHYQEAQNLKCPSAASKHGISADMQAAAEAVASVFNMGDDTESWRRHQLLQPLQQQLDRLQPWDKALRALKPESVEAVSGEVPIASIACLVVALRWPHTELPLCLLAGFDIVGGYQPQSLSKGDERTGSNPRRLPLTAQGTTRR
jgi:hypothetical protein